MDIIINNQSLMMMIIIDEQTFIWSKCPTLFRTDNPNARLTKIETRILF